LMFNVWRSQLIALKKPALGENPVAATVPLGRDGMLAR
jgi:hypothetical protein